MQFEFHFCFWSNTLNATPSSRVQKRDCKPNVLTDCIFLGEVHFKYFIATILADNFSFVSVLFYRYWHFNKQPFVLWVVCSFIEYYNVCIGLFDWLTFWRPANCKWNEHVCTYTVYAGVWRVREFRWFSRVHKSI